MTFLLIFVVVSLSYGLVHMYEAQPRIQVANGHLTLFVSEHKNISLKTSGRGTVLLNGLDLYPVVKMSTVASKTITDFQQTMQDIQEFQDTMEGSNGVLTRLAILEGKNASVGPARPFDQPQLRNINRRLTRMMTMIRDLNQLLTTNECVSNPCKNGGQCEDMFNGYLCKCPPEWMGPSCDVDVNECARFAGTDLGCQNGATCVNKIGSYECTCPNGWLGIHCTRRSADCNSGSGTEICGHGTCISQTSGTGYKCICDQGWTTEGNNLACTKDVDECTSKRPPCSMSPPVPCINIPGSFYCGSCPAGYTGNGYYCADVDECNIDNGGCSTNPKVLCLNTMGSFSCAPCPPGYSGNGKTCTYEGVCNINNGGCHPRATCTTIPRISDSYVRCTCPAGFTGLGVGPAGCSPARNDHCSSNPCVHGTCTSTATSYLCQCNFNYTGRNCDIGGTACSSNPCQNGGTCRPIWSRYYCSCPSPFVGRNCEKSREGCSGRLKDPSGTLKYPPSNSTYYSHFMTCSWTIEVDVDKVLNITFTRFNLEESSGCTSDWLQIRDSQAPTKVNRFCGNKLPNGGNILTNTNMAYLWFRSDGNTAGTGFELTWDSVQPVCGEAINVTSHGTIKSPGSPGSYPSNRDCYWHLKAPVGKRFEFHFYTLMIGIQNNCSNDYVEFRKGLSPSDPIFSSFCTSGTPQPLTSPGHEVTLHFHSDATNNYPGFQISYSLIGSIPGCGGVYTFPDGEVRSPVVDGVYAPNLLCEYKISVETNHRIEVTFTTFDIEGSYACNYDYVAIYEGDSVDSPIIGKYCRKEKPAPITTNGNQLLIVFKSDQSGKHKGFVLKYKTVCHVKLTDASGIIDSGTDKRICIFEIMQPLGRGISLKLLFAKEETIKQNCKFKLWEIRDGDNENSTMFDKYCTNPTETIISSYNHLWIKVDNRYIPSRFQANYTTMNLGCGGILTSKIGTIQSPNYPNKYKNNANCTWIISAPRGYVIQFSFLAFHLEKSYKCTQDYVILFDNGTHAGQLGKFCGYSIPNSLTTTSNLMTVKFLSDLSVAGEGFTASYNFIHEANVCGGRYFSTAGVIKSPNYPDTYPLNKECTWIINVPTGQQILLNVTKFDMEPYLVAPCRYDYLEIRNGGTAASPLIGKYCGMDIPITIPSHTNQIFLKFRSDMSRTYPGFYLTWSATTTGCGGILSSFEGTIISPNYPEPYDHNTECYWRIVVSAGSIIQIVFADLDLEYHSACMLDHIEIFDGRDRYAKTIGGKICAQHPTSIKTTSNVAYIKFRSDVSFQGRGFHLKYTTVCNNTIKGLRGVIESPNYPNKYLPNTNCEWHIETTLGNKINLTFSHFNILSLQRIGEVRQRNECTNDYVEVLYADVEDNSFLTEQTLTSKGKFCGEIDIPLITVDTNTAAIKFVSKNYPGGTGFRVEWENEGCGGVLTHPNGTITSPNYPKPYSQSTECNWTISINYGQSVKITFKDLDLEKNEECRYDYVAIYGGPNDQYPELVKVCNVNNKSMELTTSSNVVFIHFECDYSFHGRGFQLSYTMIESKCGGKYTAPNGKIHSPNYPNNFDPGDNCNWLIQVDPNHLVELKFEDVAFSKQFSCPDYVRVFDGDSAEAPLLVKLCKDIMPNETIKSSSNSLYIEMVSGKWGRAKGFRASYQTICGARIIANGTGTLDYSDYSERMADCKWTIISSRPDEHVYLTLSHLDIPCTYYNSSLSVYNGETNEAPLIGHYCDNTVPPQIVSTGSALHLELNGIDEGHFFATYTIFESECGGTLYTDGSFSSPRYPDNYPVDIQCEWNLNVSPGNGISITFSEFDLMDSVHCNEDYLEVREQSSSGKLLGTFCGNQVVANLTATKNMWLLFKSVNRTQGSSGKTGKGFLATYSFIHGLELNGPVGQIASPMYPRAYIHEGDFSWSITVTYGYKISITFEEMYIDYPEYRDTDCYISSLTIYDGVDEKAPVLSTLCGNHIPDPIKSSTNVLFLRFTVTDHQFGAKFLLKWQQVERATAIARPKKPQVPGCGSEDPNDMTEIKRYNLTSPGYPTGYAYGLICEWIFTTTPNNHLIMELNEIDLESNPNMKHCVLDNVKVYSGVGEGEWKLLKTFCMQNESYGRSIEASNLMKVIFTSDSYANRTGFSAVVKQVCGGKLEGPNGIISIDNNTYNARGWNTLECQWNVTVRPGRRILIEFSSFDLGPEDKSCSNYIVFKNGEYPTSPILGNGRYCGKELPGKLNTTGNQLYIKYKASPRTKGFKLSYKELSSNCGGSFNLNNKDDAITITSPNHPNIPSPHSECEWLIRGVLGESIKLDFEGTFDFTTTQGCTTEYVEIRDGGTKYSQLLGRYCDEMPSSIISTDSMMYIRFTTDVNDPKTGFKAKISVATCGGTIRGQSGIIRSPYFLQKDKYPTNSNCTWHIVGPRDHYLTVALEYIDIENSYVKCGSSDRDYIKISERNLINNTEIVLANYCGNTLPSKNITSGSNEVTVQFVTNNRNKQMTGFKLSFNASQESCGGDLVGESGIIQSPGYPVLNHNDRHCQWVIKVPKGRRIKLEILDFDVDKTVYFFDVGAAFFNGDRIKSHIAYLKPGDNNSRFFESTDNVMMVYFWSSHQSNHRGFRASYTSSEPTICRGDFAQSKGVIKNPDTTLKSYHCTWEHKNTSSVHQTVAISINMILTDRMSTFSSNCKYSLTSLLVTQENVKDQLGSICKTTKKPIVIRSPFPITKLVATKGRFQEHLNFTAEYSTHPCGGLIRQSTGSIQTPGYPGKYRGGTIHCAWSFVLKDEQAIRINITMEIDNCEKSMLWLHNGDSPSAPLIGKYCGSKQFDLKTQRNKLWVEYWADETSSSRGFKLEYKPIVEGCGGIFHDTARTIESPSFPSDYPNSVECDWEVRTTVGFHIGLEFVGRVHIEKSDDCKKDYLEVFDYVNEKWSSMGKYCGKDIPKTLNSTSNRMKIFFKTDDKTVAGGFQAKWSLNCGGTFPATLRPQYIVSPGYPDDYQNNLNCVYNITAPEKIISVIFDDFELEKGSRGCTYDNVTIGAINFSAARPNLFCGKSVPPPLRAQNGIIITFATDRWVTNRGFQLRYNTDDCGGIIKEPMMISSPPTSARGPIIRYLYSVRSNCIWNITAPSDQNVVVKFEKFELEYNEACTFEYFDIYEGFELNVTQRLALLCGNLTHNLPVIKSFGNTMLLRMKSINPNIDGYRAAIYFTYGPKVGCGGTLNITTETTVESPQSLRGVDCHWLVSGPSSKVLKINFEYLSMAHCRNESKCKCFVELRDGAGPYSELIDTVCADVNTRQFSTSGRNVWIRLYDMTGQRSSFKVKIKTEPTLCGPNVLMVGDSTGILTSPNYPNTYGNNIKCSWTLKSSINIRIYLRFLEFDLTDIDDAEVIGNTCNKDRVEITDRSSIKNINSGLGSATIFNKPNNKRTYMAIYSRGPIGTHQYCGQNASMFDYYSNQGEVSVTFVSGNSHHGKGFKMEYQAAGCDRNYTELQGRLLNERISFDCTMFITVPENYTISLYFSKFLFSDSPSCSQAGVEFYDGKKNTAVAKLCGYSLPSPIFSTSNTMKISVWNKSRFGSYDISYTSTNEGRGCGGIFYNYLGKFTSPMYPNPYKKTSVCVWEVRAPFGLDVSLKFTAFDFQGSCTTDYVEVTTYSGDSTNIHKFCNVDNPATLRSDSRISVKYRTSVENDGTGWAAEFYTSETN